MMKTRRKRHKKNARKKSGKQSKPQSKPRRKKLTLKSAAKAVAKTIWLHLVKLPEEEREQQIAAVERALAKKLARLTGRKRSC